MLYSHQQITEYTVFEVDVSAPLVTTTDQVRTLVSRTGWYPTLERTSPREVSPRAPCAFDLLTIGSSCDSRSFSRFASVFLGWQAK